MPRIGLTLARHIVFKGPPTPVLLMTAYAANDLDALSELRVLCLRKPFMLDHLKSEIQTALNS
jgi:CheY-like chemotaxis protein